MLEELDKLIIFIVKEYNKLFEEWKNDIQYDLINQKKKLVKDINKDDYILNTILDYRTYINENNIKLKIGISQLNLKSEINTRVKSQNSIEYKINNYMTVKHEYGKVPLNKCLNDLYGIRIIFDDKIEFKNIKKFINDKYSNKLKCYDASKGQYKAIHIYFSKSNYSFQWELQIWNREDEINNLISHQQYKQDYTKWEKENKGGESF